MLDDARTVFIHLFSDGLRLGRGLGLSCRLFLNRLSDGLTHSFCNRLGRRNAHHRAIDSGCNDRDADLAFQFAVKGGPENDVGIRIDLAAHLIGGLVEFEQGHVIAAGDIDEDALGAFHRDVVQQRIVDGLAGSFQRAVFTFAFAHAHHGRAHAAHDGADIGKVEIDQAWHDHQVRNAAHAGIEHIVCHAEGFGKGRAIIGDAEEVLVRHDDHRVDMFLNLGQTVLGEGHAAGAFKAERLGHNGDRQHAHFAGNARNDRGCASTGSATHAGSNEDHVSVLQFLANILDGFLGGFRADVGPRACAKAGSRFRAQLDAVFRLGSGKGLRIRIGYDELNALQVGLDHIVDSVASGTAYAKDQDPGLQFMCHTYPSLYRSLRKLRSSFKMTPCR